MVSERERDDLRASMPELLNVRLGITDLRRSFRCPSPGHDDSDPSARYYADNNTVHCYGCGKTWDVFTLIGELDGIDAFPEQVQAVADAVGYRLDLSPEARAILPRSKPRPRPPFDPPRPAGGVDCYEACGHAFGVLYTPGNEFAREWLQSRGIDDLDTSRFGLGLAFVPRSILPQFSVNEPHARGFITIPFYNRDFSAADYCMLRTIPGNGEVRNKEWRPKGIASPLYNEWMLSASLPAVFVTEGLIDAMALNKIVEQPVMALGGVANAKRFASVMYHTPPDLRPRSVVVCMDEDEEGRKCRDRMMADLQKMGAACAAFAPYPRGCKDADEWLMSGRGVDWDYEIRTGFPDTGEIRVTRWLDGR